MVKSNRVTLLIVLFFAIAAILNELRPSEIVDVFKTSLVLNSGTGYSINSEKNELVETFDLPTFIFLSISILTGLFIMAYFKINRSVKIIATQSTRLARQEEELQHVRQVLKAVNVNQEDIKAHR